MPTSKKSKKNKSENEKQKSLFAYIGKSKKEAHKKPQLSKDQKSKAVAKKRKQKEPEKTQELEKKGEEVQKVKDLLKKEYFKLGDLNFGLKEGEIHLESIQRESHTSKYIRYLKKANKIVKNMRRGLLLDINYDGGENKAYCKFYDLDEHDIKIWIDTTNHQPYCLSKVPKKDLEQLEDLMTYEGFDRIEEIKNEISKLIGKLKDLREKLNELERRKAFEKAKMIIEKQKQTIQERLKKTKRLSFEELQILMGDVEELVKNQE